jgi:hypothetical protein
MLSPLKNLLGNVPGAAVLYGAVRPGRPRTRFNLEQLAAHLPIAIEQTQRLVQKPQVGRKLLLFATLHYWIEQAAIVGLALRGMGYDVTIAYLPYGNWDRKINALDLRRQDLYSRRVLRPLNGSVRVVSLLDSKPAARMPSALEGAIETQSSFDVMYSLQREDFDRDSFLFRLRMERNRLAGLSALSLMQNERPDTVLIPNGLITELGVFYQAARHLELKTITYEFNDQREQIWLAQNDIVMRQNTQELWAARSGKSLTDAERERIAGLEQARRGGSTYGKGTRVWQEAAAEGSDRLRKTLHLDDRPVVLLATNVLGDSLTLGRNLFASSMAEWIARSVRFFVTRQDVQLVVRVHPGERLIKGPSMMEVIQRAAPGRPEHIHVVGPFEKANTYDIMEMASVGLAYTTTVGMEMAMRGVPVIVAGSTHYRGRGFTLDPNTWAEYFGMLTSVLDDQPRHRLTEEKIETAWNYAYRFFFEYPFAFPWRLMHFWKDMEVWPLKRVLSDEGQAAFGRTFHSLAGEKICW